MPNIRQSPGSLPQTSLQGSPQGQQLATPSHTRQSLLAQNNMHLGLMPRVQGQVSVVPQNSLIKYQPSTLTLLQLPMQPRFPHPQLTQSQVLLQTIMEEQSELSTVPSTQPQPFTGLFIPPQTPHLTSSGALEHQAHPPLLHHPEQIIPRNLGHNTQLVIPNATFQHSLLPHPLLSQPGLQPGSSMLLAILETVNKDADRSAKVTNDATWVPRSNTYSNLPLNLYDQTSMVGDTLEPMNRPTKLARLEEGRSTSRNMIGLNTATTTRSGPSQVLGTDSLSSNQIPNAEGTQQSEKQVPQEIYGTGDHCLVGCTFRSMFKINRSRNRFSPSFVFKINMSRDLFLPSFAIQIW